jgi:hypothetical protein
MEQTKEKRSHLSQLHPLDNGSCSFWRTSRSCAEQIQDLGTSAGSVDGTNFGYNLPAGQWSPKVLLLLPESYCNNVSFGNVSMFKEQ